MKLSNRTFLLFTMVLKLLHQYKLSTEFFTILYYNETLNQVSATYDPSWEEAERELNFVEYIHCFKNNSIYKIYNRLLNAITITVRFASLHFIFYLNTLL